MNYSKSEYDYRPITVKLGKNATGPLTTLIDDLGQQITFEVDNANPIYYVKAGMYHAHMEQHSRMSATLVTVMSVLYQKLCKKPLEEMALT